MSGIAGNPCVPVDAFQRHSVPLERIAIGSVTPWLRGNLLEDLMALSQELGQSLPDCAQRYAIASLPDNAGQGWWYHECLGFKAK